MHDFSVVLWIWNETAIPCCPSRYVEMLMDSRISTDEDGWLGCTHGFAENLLHGVVWCGPFTSWLD